MAGVAEAFVTVRPDMNRFGGDLRSGLGKLTKVAGVAALGITAAIGGAAVAGVRKFAELERGMNEVFTLLPGISEQAMGQMTEDVRDFAVEMGTTTEEVVPALYQALSAGVPRDNVFEFLETANKAAIGGITDLETSVDAISSVVNAYGDQIEDATEASDLMFTAVRLGKTTFEELGSSLSNVVPIAAANNVEFGNITAALATMTAQGIPTAQATTQLRQALVEMSNSGGEVGKAFEEVAGKSFPEFMAAGGNLGDALDIMQEAADEAGVPIQQLFGSVEAGNAVLALSGENMDGFRSNLEEMEGSAGATDAAFQTMNQGLSRTWDRIKVVFSELLLELGERIAPALQSFADWFEQNLPGILDWFERVGAKVGEFGEKVVVWWRESVKPNLDAFVKALQDHWPTVRDIFERLGSIVSDFGAIVGKTMPGASQEVGDMEDSWSRDVGSILNTLDGLLATVETVTGAIASSFDAMTYFTLANMGQVKDDLGRMADKFVGAFGRAIATVRFQGGRIVAWFRGLPAQIRAALSGLGGLLTGIGRDILGGLFAGMRAKWDESVGWLGSLADEIRARKGPIEKDRVLLDDIGQEIIGGLGRGMQREWANVERMLGTITAEIPVAAAGDAAERNPFDLPTPEEGPAGLDPETWGRRAADAFARQSRMIARRA